MLSRLPRSTLRPWTCRALQRYVGASNIWRWSVSMRRPLPSRQEPLPLCRKDPHECRAPPSRPQGARSRPPHSRAASRPAFGRDHMPRRLQFDEEVLHVRIGFDLHPGPAQLVDRVCVRSGCADLVEVGGHGRSSRVGRGFAPRVVDLDDVDAVSELDDALSAEVRTIAIERVWNVSETAHVVDQVHHLFRAKVWRQSPLDEESNDLTFSSLGLFADNCKLW